MDAWIKCGKDTSPEAQRRRGLVSGFRRRQANVHRDHQIHMLHIQGKSLRQIAKAVGLRSHNSVKKVLERDRTVICAQGRIALLRRTSRRFPITRRRGCAPNHLLRREHRSTGTALDVTQTRSAQIAQAAMFAAEHDRKWRGGGVLADLQGVLSGRWQEVGTPPTPPDRGGARGRRSGSSPSSGSGS